MTKKDRKEKKSVQPCEICGAWGLHFHPSPKSSTKDCKHKWSYSCPPDMNECAEVCEKCGKTVIDNPTPKNNKDKEWEKLMIDFAQWVWGLSPHNFENGNAPKFKYALKDFIEFRIQPLLTIERKRVIEIEKSKAGNSIKLLTKIRFLFSEYQRKPVPTEIIKYWLIKITKYLEDVRR